MAVSETDALTALQIERGADLECKLEHILERWAKVVDNARYLIFEHRFKEKEYGIKWRLSYEKTLETEAKMIRERFGGWLGDKEYSDYHIQIADIVEKDWLDVFQYAKA